MIYLACFLCKNLNYTLHRHMYFVLWLPLLNHNKKNSSKDRNLHFHCVGEIIFSYNHDMLCLSFPVNQFKILKAVL